MNAGHCGCARCAHESLELWERWGRQESFPVAPEIRGSGLIRPPFRQRRLNREVPGPSPASPCQPLVVLDNFTLGSYRLEAHHLAALHDLAIRLKNQAPPPGSELQIRGHTDNQGSVETNRSLGFARALEVQAFLAATLPKIKVVARLIPSSAGPAEPLAPNATEAGRRRNRRVTIGVCPASSSSTSAAAYEPAEPSQPPVGSANGGGAASGGSPQTAPPFPRPRPCRPPYCQRPTPPPGPRPNPRLRPRPPIRRVRTIGRRR